MYKYVHVQCYYTYIISTNYFLFKQDSIRLLTQKKLFSILDYPAYHSSYSKLFCGDYLGHKIDNLSWWHDTIDLNFLDGILVSILHMINLLCVDECTQCNIRVFLWDMQQPPLCIIALVLLLLCTQWCLIYPWHIYVSFSEITISSFWLVLQFFNSRIHMVLKYSCSKLFTYWRRSSTKFLRVLVIC